MGNFDGVHSGHQTIFAEVVRQARKRKGTPVVYTYNPHPVTLLAPNEAPKMIQTQDQKMESIEAIGISACIVEPFNRSFAQMSPQKFFEVVILKRIKPSFIIVGYDFTFGHRRGGTTELLETLCQKHEIGYEIIPALFIGNTLLSSTQIRKYVNEGLMEEAALMLGRPYTIRGIVAKGRGIGKALGFQTANIVTENELLPPHGVYISKTKIRGEKRWRHSVTNIGFNPTVNNIKKSASRANKCSNRSLIETHILQFNKTLYGRSLDVQLIKHLRPEQRFENRQLLIEQIKTDIATAKAFFR